MAGGAQVAHCFSAHTLAQLYTLMKLADADLVRGQTPGLSALVTQAHTLLKMRCPFILALLGAAILPSGGICVLLGRESRVDE